MAFVKNKFSYVLWACYIVFVGFGFFGLMVTGLTRISITDKGAMICICCLPLFLVAGLFALTRWFIGRYQASASIRISHKKFEWEIPAVLFLLIAGMAVRIYFIGNGTEEAAYFAAAQVNGNPVPITAHSMQYLYLCLLRGVFYVTGNYFSVGLFIQSVLQMLGAAVWYFAIKKMIGKIGSFIFLSAVSFMPYFVEEGLTYSPKILYWLLFGIVLYFISAFLEKEKSGIVLNWHNGLFLLIIGSLIGIMTYLDALGLTLFAFFFFLKLLKKDRIGVISEDKEKRSFSMQVFLLLGSFFAGIAAAMLTDAWVSHTSFQVILNVFAKMFGPKGTFPIEDFLSSLSGADLFFLILVFFFLLLGAPAFFLQKDVENQLMYVLYAVLTAVFCLIRVGTNALNYDYMLFSALIVLLASGIQELFCIPENVIENNTEDVALKDQTPLKESISNSKQQEITESSMKEQDDKGKKNTGVERYKQPDNGGKKIDYIENPLPLPKVSEKRSMGYRFEVPPEKMKYDITVSDSDDFDLKDV